MIDFLLQRRGIMPDTLRELGDTAELGSVTRGKDDRPTRTAEHCAAGKGDVVAVGE